MTERVEMRGTKSVYDCATDKWNSEPVRLLVETEPFQEGGMRIAYKAQELFADGSAMDVVLKCFKPEVLEEGEDEAELVRGEAMTQMVAENYAQDFNRMARDEHVPTF